MQQLINAENIEQIMHWAQSPSSKLRAFIRNGALSMMTACYLGQAEAVEAARTVKSGGGTKQITSASIDVMNGGLQRLSEAASPDKRKCCPTTKMLQIT